MSKDVSHLLDGVTKKNLDKIIDYVKAGRAGIIIIDGGLGSGKTTSGITIAKYIQPSFDEEKQVGRGATQFVEAWEFTEKKKRGRGIKACVFDEAQAFDRAQHASKRNQALKMFFNTFRDSKTILILCLPHFRRLDVSIYETRAVQMLIHIKDIWRSHVETQNFDLYGVLAMLDYLHRNRNDKHRSGLLVYSKGAYPNYYGQIYAPTKEVQTVRDKASNKGKKRLRKKVLGVAKEA